ncbi:Yip1 domain protein [Halovivax ruber XH-70]|uniref:Yip1 domain protein n=1 Tax=Halovivax ruber (strain DSM 18193 / JCM 13892 / XH-70) TaxID=797302 RepID=L0IG32_HALRX|nr:YIP1 family protein [Halovivax ruber]AGB17186.1 Yip1 domain protein [Halovivax ruber XH-70]
MAPRTPLRNPKAYFSANSQPFGTGVSVFLVYAFASLVVAFVVIQHVFDQISGLSPEQERVLNSLVPSLLFFVAIGFLIAWLVVAAIMHFGSGSSSNGGSFGDALGVAGWAYAPELLFLVPQVVYSWNRISALDLDGSDPARLSNRANELATQASTELVPIACLLVTTAWSVYILSYGVSETHDVSLDTAMVPAVIVGVGSIFLTLVG